MSENVQKEAQIEEIKTPKKRGRKPKSNKDKNYFGEREETAFKTYIESSDKSEKNRIFDEILYPAFTKMIESIIRRYELFTPSEDFEDTFHDTMSFLITKVNNYDVSKGFKVYSYCGTICKNYLILKRTQDMKKRDKLLSYDTVFPTSEKDERIESTQDIERMKFNSVLIDNTIEQIQEILSVENESSLNENEKKIGYALLEMLMNWEDIFKRIESKKFNKTSVAFFIKEYTMLSTKEIREGMKKFKNLYFLTKKNLIDE